MRLCLRDEELRDLLEADFCQYYPAVDLYGGIVQTDDRRFRLNPALRLSTMVNMVCGLPPESRIMRHLRNDPFTQTDHLIANVCDYLRQMTFYAQIAARAQVDEKQQSVFDDIPPPMKRPKLREEPEDVEEEEPEEIIFMTGRQLAESFGPDGLSERQLRKRELARLRAEGVIKDE